MENAMFVDATTIGQDFGVSRSKAYEIIKNMNEELKSMGYLTIPGRVSRQYYKERVYGLTQAERGE